MKEHWDQIKYLDIKDETMGNYVIEMMKVMMDIHCFVLDYSGTICYKHMDKRTNCEIITRWTYNNAKNHFNAFTKQYPIWTNIDGQRIKLEGKTKPVNAFLTWYNDTDRKMYDDIIFDPRIHKTDINKDYYNMYDGMPFDNDTTPPLEEDHLLFKHIMNVWCDDNKDIYEYILNYFAFLVQKPGIKTQSSIVLKSGQRMGKGIIVNLIMECLGRKYCYQPSNSNEVLGNFNGHLENKILVFLDEMTFGGCHTQSGILKKLITEDKLSINQKNEKVRVIDNIFNLIIASNENWVIPSGFTEKRFMVVQLNEAKKERNEKQYKDYFKSIKDTSLPALFNFLKARDISNFDPTKIIITEAFIEQSIKSMDSCYQFYYHLINNELDNINIDDKNYISTADLHNSYKEFCQNNGIRHMESSYTLIIKFRSLGLEKKKRKINKKTCNSFELNLEHMIELWEKKQNQTQT